MNSGHLRRTRSVAVIVALAVLAVSCSFTVTDSADNVPTLTEPTPFLAEVTVRSPDGTLWIEMGIDELDRARYRVLRSRIGSDNELVVGDSTLGLETSTGSFAAPGELAVVGEPELMELNFELPHGKARSASITGSNQIVQLGPAETGLALEVFVTDTAVAFRYQVDAPGEAFTIDWERTSFALPAESRTWLQQHDRPTRFTPAYEAVRSRVTEAGSPPPSPFGWTFPALFASDRSWTLITEAGVGDGAAASHLSPVTENGEYLLDFASRGEGNGIGDPRPVAEDRWVSAWRVIITSPDLGDIVESNIVRHLGATDGFADVGPWVQPGRVSWSWWSDHESSKDADAIEPFIDLASEFGWEYSLVDANWDLFGRERLAELVDYAAAREVGLFVWYNSGGPHNVVTEAPRDRMADRDVRREEMSWLAEIGVRGIKVDFFHSDKPDVIQQYRDILSDAAEHNLMVNFHGSTLPRGWQADFPNLMTMEAVRGAEFYTFPGTYLRIAPRQNTVLPFTRNVVGPMDYTPVVLGDTVRRLTTNGHELALAVVFESSLLHLADTPEAYRSQPAAVIDLLSAVPAAWDETQFISGEPESFVAIARRDGATWWIGAINGEEEPRSLRVDLGELGLEATVELTLVCDNQAWDQTRVRSDPYDPARYEIRAEPVGDELGMDLAGFGGCLGRLAPAES